MSDDWGGFDSDSNDTPGTDIEPAIIDAEIIDDPADTAADPDPDVIDGQVISDSAAEVEPWAITDDPNSWGTPEDPGAPAAQEHGVRPGGGSSGLPKSEGKGSVAGKGKQRRRRGGGGSGGGGGGNHFSLLGGVLNNASVVKTGGILSNNAGIKGRTGSGHGYGTGGRPLAGKRRPL